MYKQINTFARIMSDQPTNRYCNCLYYSVSAMSRIMTKMAEESFAVLGIAPSHAFVLLSVYREPGIQPKAIGEELQLTPSTITRLLEKLEAKGLVERKSVGRNTQVFPTEKCCGMHHEVEQAWIGLHTRYSAMLGKESTQQLTELLNAANQQLENKPGSQ